MPESGFPHISNRVSAARKAAATLRSALQYAAHWTIMLAGSYSP
jgi:hypothetical protein